MNVVPNSTKAEVPLSKGATVCVAAFQRAAGGATPAPQADIWKASNTYAVQADGSLAASLTDAGGNPAAGSAPDMELHSGTYDFYAYSPALKTEADKYTVKGIPHYTDFMGALLSGRAVSRSTARVDLKFEHKCSKVRFNVVTATDMANSSLEADSTVLYKMAVSPARDFTLGGDLLPTLGGDADTCLLKRVEAAADAKSSSVWEVLLPKSNGSFDADFYLKVSGIRYLLKARDIPAMSFGKGTQYIFNAVVRKGSVSLVLNVAAWDAVPENVNAGEGGGAGSGSWEEGGGNAGGGSGANHGIEIGRWGNVDWSGSLGGSNPDPVTGALVVGSWTPVQVPVEAGGGGVADIDSWVWKTLAAQAGGNHGGNVEDWGNSNDIQTGIGPRPPLVESANCFMVEPGKSVSFDACVKGNAKTASMSPQSVQVLWQDVGSPSPLIAEVIFDDADGCATVQTSNQTGNAVVAAYSGPAGTGDILWSWHIWVTDYCPNEAGVMVGRPANTTYRVTGGEVHVYGTHYLLLHKQGLVTMDRNLGAMKAYNDGAPAVGDNTAEQAFGLLYQWGRKDPFPRADRSTFDAITAKAKAIPIYGPTGDKLDDEVTDAPGSGIRNISYESIVIPPLVNSNAYSIRNPLVFIYVSAWPYDWYGGDMKQDHYRWGMDRVKALNDPCPAGWRVLQKDSWNEFSATTFKYYSDGTVVNRAVGIPNKLTNGAFYQPGLDPLAWYPASGFKGGTNRELISVGKTASCWSNYATGANGGLMNSDSQSLNVDTNTPRSNAYPVRCVQE